MARIDTIDKLASKIDRDLAWRKKELIALNSHAETHRDNKHILRAVFPLICAHYEGFLKKSAEIYLQHVSDLRIPLIELKHAFAPFILKSEFMRCDGSKRASVRAQVIANYAEVLNIPMIISDPKSFIDTESNPKPDVLTEILESLAVDPSSFQTKFTFINDSLLKSRNAIVHGEFCDVSFNEFQDVMNTTLEIMEEIKDLLLDSSINAVYRKTVV